MNGQIPDSGQLDLFLDSRSVVLANDVVAALLARDAVRAAKCLDCLRAEEPGHRLRVVFVLLLCVGSLYALQERVWPHHSAPTSEIGRAHV